jgi:tripartite-type tricarboxylate transporter receptor subunit TctC
LAERMKTTLGQPIVVENIPTAAGTVGVERWLRLFEQNFRVVKWTPAEG